MDNFNPNSLPDDPFRVAPPYCAPGEVEPPDAPQVSETEAVCRVVDVLKGKQRRAFGHESEAWEELLYDDLLNANETLFPALLQADQNALGVVGGFLRECITDRANNWLAEADYDQLEAERFLP